jgi:alanyl-tRNA synthetase
MTSQELRKKYLNFFKEKNHAVISSASLIPENDPTVLFTTAGMHPLVPYLMGEKHPAGKRLVDVQKCIRTGDIDEVGDAWHLTFFEMLGNWSLGDYWKKEAIEWSFEFLTKELGISKDRLAVTIFEGDKDAPEDKDSFETWKNLGIEKIYKYGKKDNWWGPAGTTGPCGPDTEIFYITDKKACGPNCEPSCSCGKYVEIWNNVFMEYYKNENGEFQKAKQKNVDTGMGLERTVATLKNLGDAYHCEHIWPIIELIEKISGKKYEDNTVAMRIVADHLRAATFILGDEKGVAPSNLDQGYVLRRLIRRAVRFGKQLGINESFTAEISKNVIDIMKDAYPELQRNRDFILSELEGEEEKFAKTLEKGLKEFEKISGNAKKISGKDAFLLFTTYGFPIEITEELANEKKLKVDLAEFNEEFKKHQELSRAGAEKKFKGGLADASDETKKLHTATHLLHAALRKILGNHVAQKGSNITPERLRFDFSHPEKMTDEQIKNVEKIVNEWIDENLEIKCIEMKQKEAEASGVIGLFKDKYGEVVKVYSIGEISAEMCGGPHAEKTGDLGKFKIIKEEAVSAGIRRIKAILEK